MDILYLPIPLSTLIVLAILGVFAWALYGGQFEDLEAEGERILAPSSPNLDEDQTADTPLAEESLPEQARF